MQLFQAMNKIKHINTFNAKFAILNTFKINRNVRMYVYSRLLVIVHMGTHNAFSRGGGAK